MRVRLYTTASCHLCEQAQVLLEGADDAREVQLEVLDIAASDDLVEHYGRRIPVLQCMHSGAELDWPFGADDLSRWLRYLRLYENRA